MNRKVIIILLVLSAIWTQKNVLVDTNRTYESSNSMHKKIINNIKTRQISDYSEKVYWSKKKTYFLSNNLNDPYFDLDLKFDEAKYRVMGRFRKYVVYVDGEIMATSLRPPISYILHNVAVPLGYDVIGVDVVNYTVSSIFLNETFFVSPPIRFDLVNYSAEISRAYSVEPYPEGVYPRELILNWEIFGDLLKIKIALTQYNLSSNKVNIVLSIGIRVFLRSKENSVFRPRQEKYDAVIITSKKYIDKAILLAESHPEYNILIVDTDYIYRSYEEAESPPYKGFKDNTLPQWSSINNVYNFSLALRIISYLRAIRSLGVRYVILFGNVISVPPSYYYWDEEYYSWYRNAYQSWIPTDFFYASPDYDLYPEYSVGRIPFISDRDADNYVEKVRRWLVAFVNNTEWKKLMTTIGGMPFGMLYYSGEATILDIINSGYTGNLTIEKYFETNAKYTKENVQSIYNGGRIFVLEFSHGSETAFYKLSKYDYRWIKLVDTGYLMGLSNSSELPIVIAPACTSGAFDYGIFSGSLKNSLGQAMIFSNAGGIAYLGMSRIAFGALTFLFDNGVIEASFLLYAQGMLKNFFKAYYNGSNTLGITYRDALLYYVLENDMNYWINIRTLFELTFLGDPLIPLPKITSNGTSPKIKFLKEPNKIRIPLTSGYAIQYKDSLVSLDVSDDGLIRYELISPMIVESFSRPMASLNYSDPTSISFSLPSGGLYILKIIDDTEKEKRLYVRSVGAEFRHASLELIDSNHNGKYELVRLNITVDLKYYSKTSTIWGFRSWIRIYFAGEGKLRINRNEYLKVTDIGERVLSFIFDAGSLLGGNNILNIDFFFFSWWPYLFTWWYSGPAIWTEFALRIITTIPQNLESAVEAALVKAEPVSLDTDQGIEAVDLYFRLRINCKLTGNLEVMIYFQRQVIGPSGGVIYFLSTLIPFMIPTYKDEVTIRYTWGLKAWYAKSWWGSKPNESESKIMHYYSIVASLRTANTKLTVTNTGNRRIYSLDNVTADSSESNEIIIENIDVRKILDTNNNTIGLTIYFAGYSRSPHFERTEIIIEKYVDGSWTQIYSKEIIMNIFIFFWPPIKTTFKACQIPIEFLGNGTFRVIINVFKYSGGKKIIASAEKIFNITNAFYRMVKDVQVGLVDKDEDSKYGHVNILVLLSKCMETVQIRYEIYYNTGDTDIRLKKGKVSKYFTGNISIITDFGGEKLLDYDNVTLKAKILVTARDGDALISISCEHEIILATNVSGTIFESGLEDYEKKLKPIIFLSGVSMYSNSSNLTIHTHIFSWFSATKNISIDLNGTEIMYSEILKDYANMTINLTGLETGKYNMSIILGCIEIYIEYSFEFIVDLSPPELKIYAKSVDKSIRIRWSTDDISGIDKTEIYVNGTLWYADSVAGGTWKYDAPEGLWNVTVCVYDKAGWVSRKQTLIIVDKTSPTIILLSPKNTTLLSNATSINISWQAYDPNGIAMTKIIVDLVNVYCVENNSIILKLSKGRHIVAIKVYDVAGNERSIYIKINILEREPDEHLNYETINESAVSDYLNTSSDTIESRPTINYKETESRLIVETLICLLFLFLAIIKIYRKFICSTKK